MKYGYAHTTNQLTPLGVTEVHNWSISKTQCPEYGLCEHSLVNIMEINLTDADVALHYLIDR